MNLYKNGRILMSEKNVHVGSQANFMLKPKLYFGVVREMNVGDTFTGLETDSTNTEFDLSEYPNGLEVTLSEQPGGGLYSFSGRPL